VAAAVRDLQADIQEQPEAGDPEFELLAREGYRACGRVGWWLIVWTSVVLVLVTAYRAFRLVLRPVWAGVAVTIGALVFLVVLLLKSLEGLE
jgi:type VI protein secretion system component VasF